MADRELNNILNSGELSSIYLGGTTSDNKVATLSDTKLSIYTGGTDTPLSIQNLIANTPTKLLWLNSEVLRVGDDITSTPASDEINIINAGVYEFAGTVSLIAPINNDVEVTLYVNGVATNFKSFINSSDGSHPMTFVYTGASTFNAGDALTLYVTSSGVSVTIQAASVKVKKIG